jgi:hypothetical protein
VRTDAPSLETVSLSVRTGLQLAAVLSSTSVSSSSQISVTMTTRAALKAFLFFGLFYFFLVNVTVRNFLAGLLSVLKKEVH